MNKRIENLNQYKLNLKSVSFKMPNGYFLRLKEDGKLFNYRISRNSI